MASRAFSFVDIGCAVGERAGGNERHEQDQSQALRRQDSNHRRFPQKLKPPLTYVRCGDGASPRFAGQSPATTRTMSPSNHLPKPTVRAVCSITAPSLLFGYSNEMYLDRKYSYRRTLPHLLKDNRPVFVTFGTFRRWELPTEARQLVFECCLREDSETIDLHALVVMPTCAPLIHSSPERRGMASEFAAGYAAHQGSLRSFH